VQEHPRSAERGYTCLAASLWRALLEADMSLSLDQVRWVAQLARLQLSDAELESMTRQLSAIVEYVNQLQQVNTEGVEPLSHALPIQNVFREDELKPSLPVDAALANAPDRRGGFYGVPAVFE
jgi:aspartyl-tRNA(Asn)/glutamyl-tRNA(Gln) amidotransferase subunit C